MSIPGPRWLPKTRNKNEERGVSRLTRGEGGKGLLAAIRSRPQNLDCAPLSAPAVGTAAVQAKKHLPLVRAEACCRWGDGGVRLTIVRRLASGALHPITQSPIERLSEHAPIRTNGTVRGFSSFYPLLGTFFSLARYHSRERPPCSLRSQGFFLPFALFNTLDINTKTDG